MNFTHKTQQQNQAEALWIHKLLVLLKQLFQAYDRL